MNRKKLINIGACRNRKDRSRTGGVVVLFEAWLQFCREQNLNTVTIDTNKANYNNRLAAYFSILCRFICNFGGHSVVMLHGTANDYLLLAPVLIFISKLCGKKVVLRKFAGNFEEIYNASNGIKKRVYNYVLRKSDVQFWETKSLVIFGKEKGRESLWFPNVREKNDAKRPKDKPFMRRFVFLSRVEKMKGLDILMECFASLPDGYHVDIYGPVKDYETSELSGKNFTYKRPVELSEVAETLAQYDVLVLPTLWRTEGYPGIIIEGYGVGIPSIASRIGAIPEIVENGKEGFLTEPGNVDDLRRTILSINEENYKELASNARAAFNTFDAKLTNDKVLNIVMS